MLAKMIVAAALVAATASAFASDVSSDRRQAFYEKAQKVERRAAATNSGPATPAPAVAVCTCKK
jgi:hypothetical protein